MAKSFYIIDGHAQIYRSYFAPFRDLTSPTGEPTKGTFVFTQMLLSLVSQRKPDYLAMVIDSGDAKVFRKDIYPAYKANRTPPPDDFHPQEARILKMVESAGIPIFAKPGFEADDLIATMAHQLCGQNFEIFLVSKDKDLRQILNSCTHMYDVQSDTVIDEAKLLADLGYTPAQAVEIQTLMGDKIDNVPGVPGVGEKTALELIRQFGTAAAVVQRADEIGKPKLRESVKAFASQLPMTRELVTLRRDVEMLFNPEACRFRGFNIDGLGPHLTELGFHALLKRIETDAGLSAGPVAVPTAKKAAPMIGGLFDEPTDAPVDDGMATGAGLDYQLIDTQAKFDSFLPQLRQQKRFAFDTETDALGAMQSRLVGMSFSWKHGQGFYVPVRGPAGCSLMDCDHVLTALRAIMGDPSIRKVGHNLKYDLMVMQQAGVEVRGIELDSMVAAFLLDPTRLQYGIDRLALEILRFRKVPTADLIGKGKTLTSMQHIDLDRIARYASEDADIALRLADHFTEKLADIPALLKLATDLETPLIDVLAEMETNGIRVDPNILKQQGDVLGARIEDLEKQIHQEAGMEFNLGSPKQLADVLFDRLNLRVVKKTKTGRSTDVEVLEKLASEHAVPKLMLEYRTLTKLKNTYLDNLPEHINPATGRIHPHFSQIGAETGRLSCNDPNLQNIPIRTDEGRRIRLAFVPGDRERNVLLTADYSQIELRVLAHFTQEPALLKAFAADEDIHRAVAAEVFHVPLDQVSKEQRSQAKTINFGIIYGVTAFGLARRIEGLGVAEAQKLIDSYNARFPGIKKFLDQCVMEARSQGYVETILKRRRPITDIQSGVLAVRNASERMAINSVVQGSAADLIKLAMLKVHRRLKQDKLASRMLLQVHDELVFETPESVVASEAEIIRSEMMAAGDDLGLTVPSKVEVGWGKNWEEGK